MFLNFQKAFDSVDIDILLNKLYFFNIRGIFHSSLKSYLTYRNQYTFMNGKSSLTRTVTHGVPQGSNFGPLLFLLLINNIPKSSDF